MTLAPESPVNARSLTLLAVLLGACNSDKDPGQSTPVGDSGGIFGDSGDPGEHTGDTDTDTDTDSGDTDTGGGSSLVGPFLEGDCDPIVPERCGFPFPSNVYLKEDPSTATGYRVNFGETTLPLANSGHQNTPELLNASDGFSPVAGPLVFLPGATGTGLTSPFSPEDSLEDDALTVILNAETGERVAHFAEVDMSTDEDDKRTLMLRPVVRLDDDTRYIVAIRGVVDADGALLQPSEVFAALRDGLDSDEPSVDARRALYDDLFRRLEEAGVAREDLQIAWDFNTASRENNTGRLLTMRDEALAALDEDGPSYTITSVETDPSEHLAAIVEGTITVPLYLDDAGPGGLLTLDADGAPVQNGTTEYPFLVMIPNSCKDAPCALVQYGHGLFGDRYSLLDTDYQELLDVYGGVGFSMDLIGMSGDDVPAIAAAAVSGDLDLFATIPDRSQQNFVNMVLAMRMMMGALSEDPELTLDGAVQVDTSERVYFGGSQGGIYGATYMAVATDVERGVLAVPGMSYSLMLPRSVYWGVYASPFLDLVISDPRDGQLALGYIQMMWDRAEPSGYAPYITGDNLPNTPDHRVLLMEAIGDHQVPNLSSELLARAVGARALEPVNIEHYGIEPIEGPVEEGNVFVDFSFGLPPVPEENVPMEEGDDPHGRLATLDSATTMAFLFLKTGAVEAVCEGACDPE